MIRRRALSNESAEALRHLIGKTIHTMFAPTLDAAGAHLSAWTLSMLLSKDTFMNFSCEWFETSRYLNDSWQITVEEGSAPIRIEKNSEGALVEPCTVSMYNATPIERIDIFSYTNLIENEEPEETVDYDQAILFHCRGGRSFCIGCMLNGPGIATYLHFSEDAGVVKTIIEHSAIRCSLR